MKAPLRLAYGRLAFLQSAAEQLDEARVSVRKALAIGRRTPGAKEDTPLDPEQLRDRFALYKTLGEVESKARDYPASRLAYGNALGLADQEAAAGRDAENWKLDAFELRIKLAELEVDAGQTQTARAAFRLALKSAPSVAQRRVVEACVKAPRSHCAPPG